MAKFGNNILKLREDKDLSAEQLAVACGLSWHAIHAYEKGQREPKMTTLMRIANALGVTVAQLLEGVEPPPPVRKRAAA